MKEITVALTIVAIVLITITIPVSAQTYQSDSQENMPASTAGNITTPIKPQGTSIEATNDTSVSENATASTAGNITTPIAPG
jgi:hypothetical protein